MDLVNRGQLILSKHTMFFNQGVQNAWDRKLFDPVELNPGETDYLQNMVYCRKHQYLLSQTTNTKF